jgi:cytidylate kinase
MSDMSGHPFPKLAITGDIGSGKSAVGRLLCKTTGWSLYSTGGIQRDIAERLGMSTLELNRYAETHPEIDEEIDNTSRALGEKDESFVIDSRIAWHFIPHAFKVYLRVEPQIAAQRILGDNERTGERYTNVENAVRDIGHRRASEVKRFEELYGIDLSDESNYDLIADTSRATPEEVARTIAVAVRDQAEGRDFTRRWPEEG